MPAVIQYLIAEGLMDGSTLTVTGKTLTENVADLPGFAEGQKVRAVRYPKLRYVAYDGVLCPSCRSCSPSTLRSKRADTFKSFTVRLLPKVCRT